MDLSKAEKTLSSEESVLEIMRGTTPENAMVPISKILFCNFKNKYLLLILLITADSRSPLPSIYIELNGPIQKGLPPISANESFKVRIKALDTVHTCIFSKDG